MKHNSSPFKWRHCAPDVILLCVRWYYRYQLSYRDVEEMLRERGLDVDHSTEFRSRAEVRSRNQQTLATSFADERHLISRR